VATVYAGGGSGPATAPSADVTACGPSDTYSLGSANTEPVAKIGIPGSLEQFAAAKLFNNLTSELFYGKCLATELSAGWNQTYGTFGAQNNKIAFATALAGFESSGLTDEEFNLLFGFRADGLNGRYKGVTGYDFGITHFDAWQQRHALIQCLVWHYTDPVNNHWTASLNPSTVIGTLLSKPEMNGMTSDQWEDFIAAVDEIYARFVAGTTPPPSYNATYNQENATSATLKFSHIDQRGLVYTQQRVIIEWETPGLTVMCGAAPVNSGDVLEISNGMTLDITMPPGAEPVFTLTDAARYPAAGSLSGWLLEETGCQPMMIASCRFLARSIKIRGSGCVDLTFINKHRPGGPEFPGVGGLGKTMFVLPASTSVSMLFAGALIYNQRKRRKVWVTKH